MSSQGRLVSGLKLEDVSLLEGSSLSNRIWRRFIRANAKTNAWKTIASEIFAEPSVLWQRNQRMTQEVMTDNDSHREAGDSALFASFLIVTPNPFGIQEMVFYP